VDTGYANNHLEARLACGIPAYFEIDWESERDHSCRGTIRHKRPENSTGFDWAKWVARGAPVRLSDNPDPAM
jgi:hypothetical protein